MEYMLVLYEDPELIATEEERKEAVQRVGEYAMGLVGDGTLKGGAPLHPVTEAKRIRTRDGQQRILDGRRRPGAAADGVAAPAAGRPADTRGPGARSAGAGDRR